MNKLTKLITLGVFGVLVSGCYSQPKVYSVQPTPKKVINWTNQPIENALKLRPKMTESQVNDILGQPIIREFEGAGSASQWCTTGGLDPRFPYDRYLIAFFYKGSLVGTRNYQNQYDKFGDCATLYREIEWKPSETVIEYRFR